MKLNYDKLLSNFAFKCKLRPYRVERGHYSEKDAAGIFRTMVGRVQAHPRMTPR